MDEQELERLEFQAHLVWLSLGEQQNLAPLDKIHRVLDAGCGTGLWTIDFGKKYPYPDWISMLILSSGCASGSRSGWS